VLVVTVAPTGFLAITAAVFGFDAGLFSVSNNLPNLLFG